MIKLETLTDNFFAKCTIKFYMGYVELENNNLIFTNRLSKSKQIVKSDQIRLLDGKKFNVRWLGNNVKKIAKLIVNEKSQYLVVPDDNKISCNEIAIPKGSIVLMTSPLIIYPDSTYFKLEIKTEELPDLKNATLNYKKGERAHRSFDNIVDKGPILLDQNTKDVIIVNKQQPTKTNNKSVPTGNFVIIKTLYKEDLNGNVDFWGYELQNIMTGKTMQLDQKATKDLAKKDLIQNATIKKNELIGKDIDLEELEQDYVN